LITFSANSRYQDFHLRKAQRILALAAGALASVLLYSCSAPTTPIDQIKNPLDTTNSSFTAPITTILSGPDGSSVIESATVIYEWRGNADVQSYSYKLDSNQWSEWIAQTSITIEYLDEGSHTFTVRALHRNKVTTEQNPPSRTFTVDAVRGSSVMFYPRLKQARVNEQFQYDIKLEEFEQIIGLRTALSWDHAGYILDSVSTRSYASSNGGVPVLFSTVYQAQQQASIDLGILGGRPKGISGTGIVLTLYGRMAAAGVANISFQPASSASRDTANQSRTIRELVGGKVVTR
jgi:hypothetical protein